MLLDFDYRLLLFSTFRSSTSSPGQSLQQDGRLLHLRILTTQDIHSYQTLNEYYLFSGPEVDLLFPAALHQRSPKPLNLGNGNPFFC
jgi:hypothetical protein